MYDLADTNIQQYDGLIIRGRGEKETEVSIQPVHVQQTFTRDGSAPATDHLLISHNAFEAIICLFKCIGTPVGYFSSVCNAQTSKYEYWYPYIRLSSRCIRLYVQMIY